MPESLARAAPDLARILKRTAILTPARFAASEIRCETVRVPMRDGIRLATDLYLPPALPAPAIVVRTPYGRAIDAYVGVFLSFARRGYVVAAQDCRGTGDSEPDYWDYYVNEPEDSHDFVEWVTCQDWFARFLSACGGSYMGQVQWQMARHPGMSTIVPDVSGLGVAVNTTHLYLFLDMYARSTGKGAEKTSVPYFEREAQMLQETLAGGYFNEPLHAPLPVPLLEQFPELHTASPAEVKRLLWERYCALDCPGRADFIKAATGAKSVTILELESLGRLFGHRISHDRHTLPHPNPEEVARSFHAAVLMRTGWYDWGLNDALATWDLLMRAAPESVRSRCRLFIAPCAHNMPGYLEEMGQHPELQHSYGISTSVEMLLHWYEAVRREEIDKWPKIIYYLMGAHGWYVADAWPPPEVSMVPLYLGEAGTLSASAPPRASTPDTFVYDPHDPAPTVGGSIVSFVLTPGSVDVSGVQTRPDVLTFTTDLLAYDVDVVGPLRLILYVSSSATDTDFAARLSDVFPDGRAIELQNGVLRTRYRDLDSEPKLLEPGSIYRIDIDMWATANRFKAGHRVRLDISSADFPRFDRNANRGGEPGAPIPATQRIYHDAGRPSHLLLPVIGKPRFHV